MIVTVKNLNKYLPLYKDRALSWIKLCFRRHCDKKADTIYNNILHDPKFKALDEINKWRFVSLVGMEGVVLGTPVNLDDPQILLEMGWNLKKCPKSRTIKVLHGLIQVCDTGSAQVCDIDKDKAQDKEQEQDKHICKICPPEKNKKTYPEFACTHCSGFDDFWAAWKGRWNTEKGKYIKVGKYQAAEEWERLTEDERNKAVAVAVRPADKYCPDACRWLKAKRFDDYSVKGKQNV